MHEAQYVELATLIHVEQIEDATIALLLNFVEEPIEDRDESHEVNPGMVLAV